MNTTDPNGLNKADDGPWRGAGRRASRETAYGAIHNHNVPDPEYKEVQAQHETAKQWGERQARQTRRVRGVCGLIIGFIIGLYLIETRTGFGMPWYVLLPIMAGCVLFCYAHFADDKVEDAHYLAWFVWPEWLLFEMLPLWALFAFFAALVLGMVGLWAAYMAGLFN
ncbi:MAG: hypothetical protein ABI905_13710 [Betaproteobacteria bacterium]